MPPHILVQSEQAGQCVVKSIGISCQLCLVASCGLSDGTASAMHLSGSLLSPLNDLLHDLHNLIVHSVFTVSNIF